MLTHDSKQDFPEPTDKKHGDVDRQEKYRTQRHHTEPAGISGEVYPQPLGNAVVPVPGDDLLQLFSAI